MSMRELVTGAGCGADEAGSSSSNPMAKLADAILGAGGKGPESQMRDIPGQGVAGPSSGLSQAAAAPQSAASAALSNLQQPEGVQARVPGPRWAGQVPGFQQGFMDGQASAHAALDHMDEPSQGILSNFLHSFITTRAPLLPVDLPDLHLDPLAKQRIRDRSSIMARHVFAEQGDQFVDEQVNALLQSLRIEHGPEPQAGVMPPPGEAAEWANAFQEQQHMNMHRQAEMEQNMAMEQAFMESQAQQNWADQFEDQAKLAGGGQDAWADEFAATPEGAMARPPAGKCPMAHMMPQGGMPAEWAAEFQAHHPQLHDQWAADFMQQQPVAHQWANQFEEFKKETHVQWVDEFQGSNVAAIESASKEAEDVKSGLASGESAKALVDTLASDPDPKFQNSQFLKFVSKMSRGELMFEGNTLRERTKEGSEWAAEFADQQPSTSSASSWANEFAAEGPMSKWAEEFAGQMPGTNWAEQFSQEHEKWANEFAEGGWSDEMREQQLNSWLEEFQQEDQRVPQEYKFAENNPYMDHAEPGVAGKELFAQGLLSEAVLAIEAELQKNGDSCEMWRLLGTVHAENDDDQQAICAMMRALKVDPENLEVLLSLGVSHTNELDQEEALTYLKRWLENNPKYADVVGPPAQPSTALFEQQVIEMFLKAAEANPVDADVHTVLGVLYNLSRDYNQAVESFKAAIDRRPQDYSLWNKLGATLANSSRSGEALSSYRNALDIKPNYVRAWSNMGIGYANQGQYEESIRYYVRALSMNPRAMNIWGYLRISCSCVGRVDLTEAVDNHNLELLEKEYPLE